MPSSRREICTSTADRFEDLIVGINIRFAKFPSSEIATQDFFLRPDVDNRISQFGIKYF